MDIKSKIQESYKTLCTEKMENTVQSAAKKRRNNPMDFMKKYIKIIFNVINKI